MPFCYEIIAIDGTSVDSLFHFLLFQTMVVNQTNLRLQCDFGLFSIAIYMHMNGLMLVQVKEESHSKGYQQSGHNRNFLQK